MPFLGKLLGLLVVLVTVIVGAMFATQNTTPLVIDVLVTTLPERSAGLWLLLTLALGVLLGLLAGALVIINQRTRLIALRRQRERLGLEVERLRKVGLTSSD